MGDFHTYGSGFVCFRPRGHPPFRSWFLIASTSPILVSSTVYFSIYILHVFYPCSDEDFRKSEYLFTWFRSPTSSILMSSSLFSSFSLPHVVYLSSAGNFHVNDLGFYLFLST